MKRFFTAALLAALIAPPVLAPSQASTQTAASGAASAFVGAFNAGPAAIQKYIRENVDTSGAAPGEGDPAADILAYRQALSAIRLVDVHDVRGRISATVQAARGGWYQVDFEPEPGGARFAGVSMSLGLPPAQRGESAEAYIARLSAGGWFSGSVLIARRGEPVFTAAYGAADRATGARNTAQTLFNIGSVGKLFTRTAIQQLIDAGKIRESDTIARWIPDYPNRYASQVTVGELETMRSGIGDFFGAQYQRTPKSKLRSLKDYLALFASQPLAFKPGSRFMYSNGSYIVLGLIVERASGEDYYKYVREHIFHPAGMPNTGYYPLHGAVANRANGYTRGPAPAPTWELPLRDAAPFQPEIGSSAGGAYSTLADLYAFSQALRNGKLLASHPHWVDVLKFVAGGSPGWNSALDVEDGFTVIALSNEDPPAAIALAQQLQARIDRR